MSNDELVNVLVPKRHLSRVYGLIAELDGSPSAAPAQRSEDTGANGEAEKTEALDEWTPSRLRKMVEQSPPAMRDILRTLAERAGEWLTTENLASAIRDKPDANSNTVAGTLGAFGRRVSNRYGLETWPFEWRRDFETRSMVYRMGDEMALQVLNLLEETE